MVNNIEAEVAQYVSRHVRRGQVGYITALLNRWASLRYVSLGLARASGWPRFDWAAWEADTARQRALVARYEAMKEQRDG